MAGQQHSGANVAFKVHIRQADETIEVGEDGTVLEAALDAGIDFPFGCQSGNCGACKSRLLDGKVEMGEFYSEYALTDEERRQGLILACQAAPRSDLRVAWLELDETVMHPQRELDCTVAELEQATHDIRVIRLKIDAGGPYNFSAGQYARVTFPGQPPRDFSMANRPGGDVVEFHVRAMDGGSVSHWVAQNLKVGDKVKVEGPMGLAFLREKHTGPILVAAGGSGLAPIKSIVEAALEEHGLKQPIHLYFGVRDERDLYLVDHFEALAAKHSNLTFVPVLSEPSGDTDRRTGFLHEAIAADLEDLDGWKAYLAGPPVMVDAVVGQATQLGARAEDVHADPFYTEHEMTERAGL